MNPILIIFSRIINYKLARYGLIKPALPINLTFSVTYKCQSRCQTCNIWGLSQKHPEQLALELSIQEIEEIFSRLGHIYFFNISGGCPFLRPDLPEIVRLACQYLRPRVIHISTNGLMPEEIIKQTTTILDIISHTDHQISLQLKPSLDGIGPEQDKIRGVDGSFEKIHFLLRELRKLREVYPQLYVGVGTTISKLNISSLPDIAAYVEDLQVDSYITEIAEIRAELFNQNMPLIPSVEEYTKILPLLIEISRKYRSRKRRLVGITQTFREIYYQLVADILQAKRQVIPCYAGISNVHLNPYGELWPCCVLGYKLPLGNLRAIDYSFRKIWHSVQAQKVRKFIQQGQCYCPLANQAYANILCNGKKFLQAIISFFTSNAYPCL